MIAPMFERNTSPRWPMRRGLTAAALFAWATAWAPARAADAPAKPARVAMLWDTSRELAAPLLDAMSAGLRDLGWDIGRTLLLDSRYTNGNPGVLPGLAANIVAARPEVVVAPLNAAALAVRQASKEVPTVFVLGLDPAGIGPVSSLSRPGKNATGMAVAGPETAAKRLQIVCELAPQARRIGVAGNAGATGYADVRAAIDAAAATLGVTIVDGTVSGSSDLKPALAKLAFELPAIYLFTLNQKTANALDIAPSPALRLRADRLIE